MFIGREPEIDQLRREFDALRASLIVIYGRRRVGKSALIRQASTGRPHVAYQAPRLTPSLNLEAFKTDQPHLSLTDAKIPRPRSGRGKGPAAQRREG